MTMISVRARTSSNGLAKFLWTWLAAGSLSLLLFPPLRHHDPIWGWLPFWCVIAPLIDLAFVQRVELLAAGKTLSVRIRRRRRVRRQAVALRGWGKRQCVHRSNQDQQRR
ncbi:MAG TPA: hypothetical protein VFN13_07370 [Rudaea sp.]|nr:hypothetical protein [Rudaea sp.]